MSSAALISVVVAVLISAGLYLALRPRLFSLVLGLTLLGYGVNFIIFFAGRIGASMPPLALPGAKQLADPLPQALVLTAIVIGFGMSAYLIAVGLSAVRARGHDHVDGKDGAP